MTHFLDTLTVTELEEMERKAYAEGDTLKAELLARVAELEKQVEALEEQIEDTETLEDWEKRNGPAGEYKQFFEDCFEMLNGVYPAPSVTSDHDKSVIFDAIRLGEETR
jgi:hypothetical protein